MTSPESPRQPAYDEFELSFGEHVIDLLRKSRLACHDEGWARRVAPQLLSFVQTFNLDMEDDVIRERLNGIWVKAVEKGPDTYLHELDTERVNNPDFRIILTPAMEETLDNLADGDAELRDEIHAKYSRTNPRTSRMMSLLVGPAIQYDDKA